MSDYRAVVEHLRGFLASSYQVKSDDLVAWAEQYARLCREANERLRQCADYLKQGLRVEAIHCADAAPNLLDVVAALDFPELAAWNEACFRLELPSSFALLLDTAAQLNEAYAQEQPLDGLMARHRLLALARAPLKDRISIMRRIAGMDPSATVFADDIRTYERLRLEEIRTAVPAMARKNDADGIRGLQAELNESWQHDVPRDLRLAVDNLAVKFTQSAAEAELRSLLPALNDAYSEMSVEEVRAGLAAILAVAARASMPLPDDLRQAVDPISNWLREQDARNVQQAEFQKACDLLQQAMDTDLSTPVLDGRYREALRFHIELPPQLEARYRNTTEQRTAAIRHKRLLAICAVAGAFLLLGGIAAVLILRSMRSTEIENTVAMIKQATGEVAAGSVDKPRQIVKQLLAQHAGIGSDPVVMRAASDFNNAVSAEQQRVDQFQKNMTAVLAGGIDKPDMQALQGATAIAKTADEQQAIVEVNTKITEYSRGQQSKIDDKFSSEVTSLSKDISEQLKPAALESAPLAEMRQKIAGFKSRVMELGQRQAVSPGLRQAQSQALLAILKQCEGTVEHREAALSEAADVDAVVSHISEVKSIVEQATALKEIVAKVKDSALRQEYQQALDLVAAETAIEAWVQLTTAWNGQLLPGGASAASARAAELKKFLESNPSHPLAKEIAEYVDYLNLGIGATAPAGPWKKAFHELMLNPLVHDLHCVTTVGGKRYYTMGKPVIKSQVANDRVVAQEFDAITSSDVSRKERIRLHAPEIVKVEDAVSPQGTFAAEAIKLLDSLDYAGWDTMGAHWLHELLASREMDPILKGILVHNLLQRNQDLADWGGDTACKKVLAGLTDQNVEDVEWLNPDSPAPTTLVAAVNDLLSKLPPADEFEQAILARRNKMLSALPVGLSIDGVLLKEHAQAKVAIHSNPLAGTIAYAVGASKRLRIVARRTADGWAIDAAAAQDVPGGSLLFLAATGK